MKIRINGVPVGAKQSEARKPITKEEQDRLFDVVVTLANFADEKGLGDVSDKLEETLDMLLDPGGSARTKFASARRVGWASSRRKTPVRPGPAVMSELKKATRGRLSALS